MRFVLSSAKNPFDLRKLGELEAVASLAQVPPFHLDLWQAQNVYYELLQMISREQHVQFSGKWLDRFQQLGEQLGVAVGESLLARGFISLEVEPAYPTSELVQEAGAAAVADAVMMSSHGLQMPIGPIMTSACRLRTRNGVLWVKKGRAECASQSYATKRRAGVQRPIHA
jgi:hypothetical protein